MTARDTKRPNSHQSAMKWSAFVLSACLLMSGLAALQPWRIARAAAPSVVQFSASTYNVSEDMTFKTITVLRTADISGPATVDYTTGDVTASQRSDYTAAMGTLRFAANESSKSFDVLISEDLKREGTETLTITLANGMGQACSVVCRRLWLCLKMIRLRVARIPSTSSTSLSASTTSDYLRTACLHVCSYLHLISKVQSA